nr:tetratricopeptide repeat protein [Oceanicola sp. 22II-s10i]
MGVVNHIYKTAVAALASLVLVTGGALAQDDSNASLLDRLKGADPADAKRIEREIRMEWAKSGSPAMDLLLKRGRDALEAGDVDVAIGHLSALTDHAPDFAEGWHTRAMVFFRTEEFGLALYDLEQTLALNPQHYAAIYGLGVVMESLDKTDEAFRLYEMVLDINPNHEEAKAAVERLRTRVSGTDI